MHKPVEDPLLKTNSNEDLPEDDQIFLRPSHLTAATLHGRHVGEKLDTWGSFRDQKQAP